jgi:hypothetical protein
MKKTVIGIILVCLLAIGIHFGLVALAVYLAAAIFSFTFSWKIVLFVTIVLILLNGIITIKKD